MLSLNEAQERIFTLCTLLSFANGGYVNSLYIEGMRFGDDPTTANRSGALVLAPNITPLELVGDSWVVSIVILNRTLAVFVHYNTCSKHQHGQKPLT